jgi:hypothetical protein
VLVVDGGGGTGQIIDLIGFDIERKSHIVPDHLEAMMIEHALDIAPCAGEILSTQMTLAPCLSKRSHKWEPRNPAPPVTSTRVSRCNAESPKNVFVVGVWRDYAANYPIRLWQRAA